jgi:hypothetical protein
MGSDQVAPVPLLYARCVGTAVELIDQPTADDLLPHPVARIRQLTDTTKHTRVKQETTDDS